MVVKRKAGRPRRRKVVKKQEVKTESKVEAVEAKQEKEHELFPKRTPIMGGDEYIPSDPTELVRDGKPWVPEENGYVARLMSPEHVKVQGLRDYVPVPVDAGIRFKDHPLTEQELGNAGDAGSGVYLHPKTGEMAQKELGGDELALLTGGRSKYVKLNSSFLCLIPREKAEARRRFAKDVSNNTLSKQLAEADREAQEELGRDKRRAGIFKIGGNAQRSEVDGLKRTTKKIWSVPAKIK